MLVTPFTSLLYNQDNELVRNFIRKHNPKISTNDIERIVQRLSKEKMKWTLIGIMKVESHFESTCYSKKTIKKKVGKKTIKVKIPLAIGLMGVNVCNIDELKFQGIIKRQSDLFDIEKNISAGIYIFNQFLLRTHGNTTLALKFYFNGPGNVYKNPEREDYNDYVADVYEIVGQFAANIAASNTINETLAMK
jgi:hypothetical protein